MTNIAEIYNSFMRKISDYSFLSPEVTRMEIEDELFGYFDSARAVFYKCKNDLTTIEDEDGEVYIVSDITPYEREIIVKLMLVEYMSPIVASSEVLKQSLSDKDFKIYSQANQLRELNLLFRLFQRQANKMITEYSYMGMTDNDK